MNNYVFCCSSRIRFKLTSYFKLITKTILGAELLKLQNYYENCKVLSKDHYY